MPHPETSPARRGTRVGADRSTPYGENGTLRSCATAAVVARGLEKNFHAGIRGCSARVAALRGVDLDVPRGMVLGVLGPPGSGKTTLLLCLAGLLRADAGTVRWFGRAADESGPPAGLAYVPERPTAYGFMTVREAIEYHAVARDLAIADRSTAVDHALELCGLASLANAAVSTLPFHDLDRLAIARALIGRPRILLLDETMSSMEPPLRHATAAALQPLVADGAAIVVAGCDLAALDVVAERIAVMLDGRIVALTTPAALRRARALEVTIASTPNRRTEGASTSGSRVAEFSPEREIIRVPLENTTPEAILARFRACGLRVERSRIIVTEES